MSGGFRRSEFRCGNWNGFSVITGGTLPLSELGDDPACRQQNGRLDPWPCRAASWATVVDFLQRIGSHTRAFAFVGGVTAMVVSDNLKSGITKACFYEPAPAAARRVSCAWVISLQACPAPCSKEAEAKPIRRRLGERVAAGEMAGSEGREE
jgi:hypothetical protein